MVAACDRPGSGTGRASLDLWRHDCGQRAGHIGSGGGAALGVEAIDASGAVIDWYLGGIYFEPQTFAWKPRTVTVVVPAGAVSLRPRFFGQGGGELYIASTSFEQTPFPVNTAPNPNTTLSADWTMWQQYPSTISLSSWTSPFNYLAVAMANPGGWEVGAAHSDYGVTPGEWWTFSSLVCGSGLGASGSSSGVGIVAYDSANNVVNWNLGNAPVLVGNIDTWTPTSVTTKIPIGVSKVRPRFTWWGGGTIYYAASKFQRAMPPIVGPGAPLPDGWGFWQEYAGTASATFVSSPDRIHTSILGGNQFELDAAAPFFNAEPGQQWTLSADVSGTNLGQAGGGVALNVVALDAAGHVLDWTLGGISYETGSFARKTVSKTVTVPGGAYKLQPRFYCYQNTNGAAFDIYTAKFERANYPTQLTPPTIPPSHVVTVPLTPVFAGNHGIVNLGQTITWQVAPLPYCAATLNYSVVDANVVEVICYVAKVPARPSPWGAAIHNGGAVALLGSLLNIARRERDDELAAIALGLASHCAIDRALHPLVNALARAYPVGANHDASHREVEKFQSVCFHEQYLGRDTMGTPAITGYLTIQLANRLDARMNQLLRAGWSDALGTAPSARELTSFVRGYAAHARLLGTPLGKRVAPPAAKAEARPRYLHGPWGSFESSLDVAITLSLGVLDAVGDVLDASTTDVDAARRVLAAKLPAGTIDPQGGDLDLARPVHLTARAS